MKDTTDLAGKKIGPLLLSYYMPAFIGVITGALYNIIGRIFIGRAVGHEALSGLSVVFPIMVIIMGFGMLCGIGSGIMTSMALGKNDKAYAEKILGNAVILMISVSLILTATGFIIKIPLLHSFGATHETIEYANDYLNIILIGTVFGIIGYGLNSSIRSEGNAKIAMYSMLVSIVINVVLDAILILWLNMGVKGAALATIIAQFALMLFVILHFKSNRAVINLHLHNLKPDKEIVIGIISSGMAPFVMQIANSVIQGVFNTQLIKYGGDISVAVMGIINSVVTLFVMSIIALNMAAQPIFGYNYSAGNYKRVKETLNLAIKSATILAIIAFTLGEVFPHWIILMFNNNEELIAKGTTGMRIFMLMFPLVGFQIITSNFLQSIGRVNIATLMTLTRQVFLILPMLFLLPKIFFLNGVWLSMPVSDGINFFLVIYFLKKYSAKIDYKIENTKQIEIQTTS
ncbi:MAG: MATE family efflux transporter [Leptospirales bacterium]|nr:MATE family efflux transporter [Leptospirales bacterium]